MFFLKKMQQDLQKFADPDKAMTLQGFFKTGKGEYGEGDQFLGIVVPIQRQIAKKYSLLSLRELEQLLRSGWHEERLTALLILVSQYQSAQKHGDLTQQQNIFDFYLAHVHGINNWDLVDLSAAHIVGHYLLDKDKSVLSELVLSDNLWERRIAMVATHTFIRHDRFQETFSLAKKLLYDSEDLIHKATGWMLREVGKRDLAKLEGFLDQYYSKMPRTMLRYAIEKLPENKRQAYLQK